MNWSVLEGALSHDETARRDLCEEVQLLVVVVAGHAAADFAYVPDGARERERAAHRDAVRRGPEPVRLVGNLIVDNVHLDGQIGNQAEPQTLHYSKFLKVVGVDHLVGRAGEHTVTVLRH